MSLLRSVVLNNRTNWFSSDVFISSFVLYFLGSFSQLHSSASPSQAAVHFSKLGHLPCAASGLCPAVLFLTSSCHGLTLHWYAGLRGAGNEETRMNVPSAQPKLDIAIAPLDQLQAMPPNWVVILAKSHFRCSHRHALSVFEVCQL